MTPFFHHVDLVTSSDMEVGANKGNLKKTWLSIDKAQNEVKKISEPVSLIIKAVQRFPPKIKGASNLF